MAYISPVPLTVEQPAPVVVRFPALRTPLDAKLRKTALRVFYRMWFDEIAEFDEEATFSVHTAEMALKLEIARCGKIAEHERREAMKFENRHRREWHLLWHEQATLKADAWRNLLMGDLIMFRLCFAEVRRVRADIEAEQSKLGWPSC